MTLQTGGATKDTEIQALRPNSLDAGEVEPKLAVSEALGAR